MDQAMDGIGEFTADASPEDNWECTRHQHHDRTEPTTAPWFMRQGMPWVYPTLSFRGSGTMRQRIEGSRMP